MIFRRIIIYLAVVAALAVVAWYLYSAQLQTVYYIAIFWVICVLVLTWLGNYLIYLWLNQQLPWTQSSLKRILYQLLLSGIYTLLCVNLTYYLFKTSFTDTAPDSQQLILLNIYGTFVIIPVFSMYFGIYFLTKWKKATIEAEELKKEHMRTELLALKNHIDPHFLFNNLNILSSLIQPENEDAQHFLEKFSDVYRYVLRSKEAEVIKLSVELDFLEAYLFLVKKRFSGQVHIDMQLQHATDNKYIPPLSLQMLVENALKHNKFSMKKPLNIKIYIEDNYLVVSNNVRPLAESGKGETGSGLYNIRKRYALISDTEPIIDNGDEFFVVKLPLLSVDG